MAMHVVFPGPRTTIQDRGRLGYQNSGFAPSGFIDRVASHMANVLVENDDSEAVIEFCLIGPILRFDEEVNIATFLVTITSNRAKKAHRRNSIPRT